MGRIHNQVRGYHWWKHNIVWGQKYPSQQGRRLGIPGKLGFWRAVLDQKFGITTKQIQGISVWGYLF